METIFFISGDKWRVSSVDGGNPLLVDRTGTERLATTDPVRKQIYIRSDIKPPLLDLVLMHEVTHALTVSYDLLRPLRSKIQPSDYINSEEWAAQLMAAHGIEAAAISTQILGRPVCVRGWCYDRH